MSGGSENDALRGDAGRDTLDGGTGDDAMAGGGGADVFVFANGFGSDTISDFEVGIDRLDFRLNSQINSLADFNAAAISFSGNTLVSLTDGSTIVISGILEAQLTAGNFIF